jgi:hypothetical protein
MTMRMKKSNQKIGSLENMTILTMDVSIAEGTESAFAQTGNIGARNATGVPRLEIMRQLNYDAQRVVEGRGALPASRSNGKLYIILKRK